VRSQSIDRRNRVEREAQVVEALHHLAHVRPHHELEVLSSGHGFGRRFNIGSNP